MNCTGNETKMSKKTGISGTWRALNADLFDMRLKVKEREIAARQEKLLQNNRVGVLQNHNSTLT